MESLLINRKDLIQQTKNLIDQLYKYLNTLEKEEILEEVVNTTDVKKSSIFIETKSTKEPTKEPVKKKTEAIATIGTNNYKDYYDADSMPNIKY